MQGRDGIVDGLRRWWNCHFQYNALIPSKLVEQDMTCLGTNGKQFLTKSCRESWHVHVALHSKETATSSVVVVVYWSDCTQSGE